MPGEYFNPIPQVDDYIKNDPTIKALLLLKFNLAKDQLLKDFEEHSITQELDAGPDAGNISGTLNGYGNLFSYIGFEAGDNPTEIIRQLIDSMDASSSNLFGFNGAYFLQIQGLISIEEFYRSTPMPFLEGRSWILGIETDTIGGIAQYKRAEEQGRSTGGIQIKPSTKNYNSYGFRATDYFTPMYNKFLQNIGAL